MKMKMKLFLAASMAVATLASCSQDETLNGEAAGGELTLARVEFTQAINTMAPTGASTPTPSESALVSACVYVFNGSTLEAKEMFTNIGASSSKVFPITTGTKSFYVAANYDNYPGSVGDPKDAVLGDLKTITSIAEATVTSKYWMTNVEEVKQAIVPNVTQTQAENGSSPSTNYVEVSIGRATAKVACDFVANTTTNQPEGLLSSVTYRVKQLPKSMYFQPFTTLTTTSWTAPFYADATVTASNYLQTAVDASAFVTTGVTGTPCTNFFYAMENKNALPKEGNTTYLVVKGTFTPNVTLDADGANPAAGVNAADFWRIKDASGAYLPNYYRTAPTPATVAAAGGAATEPLVKYTAGVSYYRLWLADNSKTPATEKYTVKRNNFYWVSITSVAGAGENEEGGTDPVDPENPIEVESYMKANIVLLPWTVVEQNTGI